MREIVCRAWLKKSHEMIDVVSMNLYTEAIIDWSGSRYKSDDYELMLSTGLIDKNMNIIFEGDIISCLYEIKNYRVSRNYQVIWENCGFVLSPYGGAKYGPLVTLTQEGVDYLKAEVLGNIYENPELIKENGNE